MANLEKAKPGVAIQLGGKERLLIYDHWAIATIIEEKGPKFLGNLQNLDLAKLIFLLWAGLIADNSELDAADPNTRRQAQKKVAKWLEDIKIEAAVEAVAKALAQSTPLSGGEEAEKNDQAGSQ